MATLCEGSEQISGEILSATAKDAKLRVEDEHVHRGISTP
jgi:hypothetical protein